MHPTYLHTIITGARTWRIALAGNCRPTRRCAETTRADTKFPSLPRTPRHDRSRGQSPRTGYQFIAFVRQSDGGVHPRRIYTCPLQASETRSSLIGRPRCSRWRTYLTVPSTPDLSECRVFSAVSLGTIERHRGNASRVYTFPQKLEWR